MSSFQILGFCWRKNKNNNKKKICFWTMISFPQWLNRERKELKKEAGVKRDATRLTIVQKLSHVSTKGTLPP